MRILTQIKEITDIVKACNTNKLLAEQSYNTSTYRFQYNNRAAPENYDQPLIDYLEKLPPPVIGYLVSLVCIGRDRLKITNANDFKNYHEDVMSAGGFRKRPEECKRYLRDRAMNLDQFFSKSKKYAVYINT